MRSRISGAVCVAMGGLRGMGRRGERRAGRERRGSVQMKGHVRGCGLDGLGGGAPAHAGTRDRARACARLDDQGSPDRIQGAGRGQGSSGMRVARGQGLGAALGGRVLASERAGRKARDARGAGGAALL
jgi:hypothetical protein